MSKTFRRAAMSTICMLIVAVMSLTGATYAWFTTGTQAEVTGMHMDIAAAEGGIEVSSDGTTFGTLISIDTKDKVNIKPVSTVAADKFVTATFNPKNNKEIATLDDGTNNVIVQDLWIQNTGVEKVTVSLDGSYLLDAANVTLTKEATEIAKAARIAIFEGETLLGIIAPHKDGEIITEDTGKYLGAKESYTTGNEPTFFEYEKDTDYTDEITLKASADIKVELLGLNGTTPQPKKLTIKIWLEGQDADCTNPNAAGAFDIYLKFGKVATTPATPEGN